MLLKALWIMEGSTLLTNLRNTVESMIFAMRRRSLMHRGTIGVAERMNRTVVEKVRSMLRMSKMPKTF